jgi:outer membrane protein TolC
MRIVGILTTAFLYIAFADESILKPSMLEILNNKKDSLYYESLEIKQSILSPLIFSSTYTKSNSILYKKQTTSAFGLSVSQDIFKFGGLYYLYKLANSKNITSKYSIMLKESTLTIEAYQTLYQIRQLNLKIENKKYEIENKNIYLNLIEEKYKHGLLGASELDNGIIELNKLENILQGLIKQKYTLMIKFKKYSDKDIKDIKAKEYPLLDKADYLSNSLFLRLKAKKVLERYYSYKAKSFGYAPSLSVFGNYNWQDIKESDNLDGRSYNYGVKLTIPIQLSSYASSQKYKKQFLIEKLELDDDKLYYQNRYDFIIKSISLIDIKIKNKKNSLNRYRRLYDLTASLYKNSFKTKQDVKIIGNRLQIELNEISAYKIDKSILINSLYLQ